MAQHLTRDHAALILHHFDVVVEHAFDLVAHLESLARMVQGALPDEAHRHLVAAADVKRGLLELQATLAGLRRHVT